MKFNNKVIAKLYREAKWELPPFDFKKDQADLVFPFDVKAGFINATQEGNTFSTNITDFSRFQRIFTGFEAVILEWRDSTGTEVLNGKLVKKFNTGNHIPFWIDSTNNEHTYDEIKGDATFLSDRVVTTVEAYTVKEISELDIMKMYVFPKRHGKVIFNIKGVEIFNNPEDNTDKYYKVTFESVNDKLSHTGIAINQYIQNSAPGEGYAYPELISIMPYRELRTAKTVAYDFITDVPTPTDEVDDIYVNNYLGNEGVTRLHWEVASSTWNIVSNEFGVIIDEQLIRSNPVGSMQFEIFGKGILSDIYFYGRPLKATNDERGNEVVQSRQLLLNEAQQPDNTQRDITQPYARNTAYNWIKRSQLVVESWYDSWADQRKSSVNPGSTKKWMGALEMFYGDANEVVTVNPVARFFGDVLTLGIAEAFWPTTTEFKKTQGENGTVYEVQPDASGLFDFSTMFNNNFYRNKSVPRLPVDYQESVIWSLKEIPLIGGFLNKLTLGLNRGWRESADLGGKHYNVSGIIPTGLLNFYQNAYMPPKKKASTAMGGSNQAYSAIPLDDLQDKSSPSSTSKVDYATILNYTLTDQFTDVDDATDVGKLLETADFNYQDDAGNPLVVWDQSKSHATTNASVDGYAIDLFGMHFIGDADIKVTFFDINKNPVWTSKLKTLSNLTDSVRDWNTSYKVSSWNAPAGIVVDGKSPYRMKPSDYTINVSDAMQDKLRNGFPKTSTSHGSFETDVNGNIIRDNNGNPISKITSTGVQETTAVANLVDGAVDNAKTVIAVNQKITSIKEFILPVSPTRILEIQDKEYTTKSTSLHKIFETQKFSKNEILQFNKIMIKPTFTTTDRAFNTNDYEGTDAKTYSYDLTFNVVQTNDAIGYRFELANNFNPVSDSRKTSIIFGTGKTIIEWTINNEGEFTIHSIKPVGFFQIADEVTQSYFNLNQIVLIQ